MVKFGVGIKRHKCSEYVGKTVAAENTAADRRQIAELHADNMAHGFTHGIMRIFVQSRIRFQIAQRNHRADGKLAVCFFNGVEFEIGKVDGDIHIARLHFQPEHAADDAVCLFLVQFICFFQRLHFTNFFNCKHISSPFLHKKSYPANTVR